MMQLSLAYLFAAGLIAVLVVLSRRNRKQGWRKQRGLWLDVQSAAAVKAFEAREDPPAADAPLQHIGDLGRLQQSLTDTEHERLQKKEVKKVKMLA